MKRWQAQPARSTVRFLCKVHRKLTSSKQLPRLRTDNDDCIGPTSTTKPRMQKRFVAFMLSARLLLRWVTCKILLVVLARRETI